MRGEAARVVGLYLWVEGRVEWRASRWRRPPPRPQGGLPPHTPTARPAKLPRYEPLIAGPRQKADLVVLGETIPLVGARRPKYEDIAEPIPGPSTEYFGSLARRHNLHLVAGLYERQDHLIYNVAVLLGPDGTLLGKYRKTCLPRSEAAAGIAPGEIIRV